jgi:hypothetical protein
MKAIRVACFAAACSLCFALIGCNPWFWGGAGVGALGTGAAYEHENREAREALDKEFERGQITKDEYLRRKKELEGTSVLDP